MSRYVRETSYMCPVNWGKIFWDYLFLYAQRANSSGSEVLRHFLDFLFFIPCKKCRVHFKQKLFDDPPPRSGFALFTWLWLFKNEVNTRQRCILKMNKQNITLKKAIYEQKRLCASEVMRNFVKTLHLTKPAPAHAVANPHTLTYTKRHVFSKVKKLSAHIHQKLSSLFSNQVLGAQDSLTL